MKIKDNFSKYLGEIYRKVRMMENLLPHKINKNVMSFVTVDIFEN